MQVGKQISGVKIPKTQRWKKILLLIFLIFVFFVVLNAVLPTALKYQIISKLEDVRLGKDSGNLGYIAKIPKPILDLAQTKIIKASEGGRIKVTDEQGVEAELIIFPGSLKKDTQITLSPLSELPIKNYGKSSVNGVLIEPQNIEFKQPALLAFNFNPALKAKSLFDTSSISKEINATTQSKPNNSEDVIKNAEDVMKQLQKATVLGIEYATSTESAKIWAMNHISSGGEGDGSNKNEVGNNNVNNGSSPVQSGPSSVSDDGNSVSAPVSEGGAYTPDELDEDQAEKISEEEKKKMDGGTCDYEAMQNILWLAQLNQMVPGGNPSSYMPAVDKCADKMIEAMKQKCAQDKTQVRRRDFLELLELFRKLYPADNELTRKLLNVMHSCTAVYEFKSTGEGASDSSILTLTINGNICGFVDDKEWKGKIDFEIVTPIPGIGNHITHTENSFAAVLPSRGGAVNGQTSNGTGYISIAGKRFGFVPQGGLGSFGFFDGIKTIGIDMPIVSMPKADIKVNGSCEDPMKGNLN